MVTRYTVVQDGQVYEPGDDVPDMGSITALERTGVTQGSKKGGKQ